MKKILSIIIITTLLLSSSLTAFADIVVKGNGEGPVQIYAFEHIMDYDNDRLTFATTIANTSNADITRIKDITVSVYNSNNQLITKSSFQPIIFTNGRLKVGEAITHTFVISGVEYNGDVDNLGFHFECNIDSNSPQNIGKALKIYINGSQVISDVAPVIVDGRTMVPVRFVTEELGCNVAWEPVGQIVTITKGNTIMKLVLGSDKVDINGKTHYLDVPAYTIDGRTMVPVRFIMEQFDKKVIWGGDFFQVIITDEVSDIL